MDACDYATGSGAKKCGSCWHIYIVFDDNPSPCPKCGYYGWYNPNPTDLKRINSVLLENTMLYGVTHVL